MNVHKKIKVARIVSIPEAFTHIVNNIKDYQSAGFEVDLICSFGSYGEHLKAEHRFNVIYYEIPRDISLFKDLKALFQLARLFIKNDYDIVHSYTPKAGLLTALAGIISFRRVRLHSFTGQRWVTLKQPLKGVMKFLDKLIIALNTKCYADSPSQVDFLIDEGIANRKNVVCLGEGSLGGIDPSKVPDQSKEAQKNSIAQKHNIPVADPWCIYVGRVVKDKGVEELIAAHQLVLKDANYQLIIMGHFEDHLDPIKEKTKATIHDNKNIHYIGFQNNPWAYMQAADFICLPSYREGFGSVIIEAAACETPAVGTDIPGLKDAILNQKTGILVAAHDVQSLAEALKIMVVDQSLRIRMGQAAKIRALSVFDYHTLSNLQMKDYVELSQ